MNGLWKLEISLQEQVLPVLIHVTQNQSEVSATLMNSDERLELKGGIKDGHFILDFPTGYARFKGVIDGEQLKGHWIRTNKENYEIPFIGHKTTITSLYKSYASKSNLIDLKGNWKVKLDEKTTGLGVFKQDGARVQGSILTETGDYRYLDGYIEGNQIKLFGFDGVFSFIIQLIYQNNELKGMLYSGKSHQQEIVAMKDNAFELSKATEMTKLTSHAAFNYKAKDIDGIEIDFSSGEYAGVAKVIQLFGSWCPNCIDETHYFLQWRQENQAKLNNVKFVIVAFEKEQQEAIALKNLKKLQYKLKIDYPIVLADFDKSKKVTDIFPIDEMRAFPTTLFLNKKNEIIKVHTGFSGQATGEYFEKFKLEFNEIVDQLIQ